MFRVCKNNELVDFEKGSHEIEGDNLFVNIVEYETTTLEKESGKRIASIWIFI